MPLTANDVLLKFSNSAATAGNVSPGNGLGSLGGFISTSVCPDNVLDALFDDVTAGENAAANVDYKCLFVHNTNATLPMNNVSAYLPNAVSGGAIVEIALDNLSASLVGSLVAQAAIISSEDVAPSGVGLFSAPANRGAGLNVGTLAPGQCRAIWLRRTAADDPAVSNDGVTLRIECDDVS